MVYYHQCWLFFFFIFILNAFKIFCPKIKFTIVHTFSLLLFLISFRFIFVLHKKYYIINGYKTMDIFKALERMQCHCTCIFEHNGLVNDVWCPMERESDDSICKSVKELKCTLNTAHCTHYIHIWAQVCSPLKITINEMATYCVFCVLHFTFKSSKHFIAFCF